MKKSEAVGIVILAAGASTRLGEPKQLLKLGKSNLLQHIIDASSEAESALHLLVLGAHSDKILNAVNSKNAQVVINPDWQEGIASSIRAGVTRSLERLPEIDHLLFLLSDQPFVTPKLIQSLIATHLAGGNPITASRYGNTLGVPAIFSKELFPRLLELTGDQGAGRLIRQCADPGIVDFELGHFDVDTREDYERLNPDVIE